MLTRYLIPILLWCMASVADANTTFYYPDQASAFAACQAEGSIPGQACSPNGHGTTYAYDPLNRITSVVHRLQGTTSTGYDSAGHLASLTAPNGANQQTAPARPKPRTQPRLSAGSQAWLTALF